MLLAILVAGSFTVLESPKPRTPNPFHRILNPETPPKTRHCCFGKLPYMCSYVCVLAVMFRYSFVGGQTQ